MNISGPGESPLLLIEVIKLIDRLAIRYAIIGAMAVSFFLPAVTKIWKMCAGF